MTIKSTAKIVKTNHKKESLKKGILQKSEILTARNPQKRNLLRKKSYKKQKKLFLQQTID